MEAVARGENISILQTDFCKAYDYVNRVALIEVLRRMNAPIQVMEVVKKVLQESTTLLPSIGNENGERSAIRSRTGVRQGCPISPLLFIIIFDVLLASLLRNHSPKDLSGFMDDLGMTLKDVQTINELTPTFQKYERATGAKLNFNKCFVLSTQEFVPEGPWAEMSVMNYRGSETTYLGVRIGKKMDTTRDWANILRKMRKVGGLIKKRAGSLKIRISRVNIFLIPLMGYLGRFKLIPKATATQMWKHIRTALGASFSSKTTLLTSRHPYVTCKPQILHPVIFNWALLLSKKPEFLEYRNPLSIGAMKHDAMTAARDISPLLEFNNRTKNSYNQMVHMIPVAENDFYVGQGSLKYLIYNLAHPLRPQLKRTVIKFFCRGLPTMDKVSHFSDKSNLCRLCHESTENRDHILYDCSESSKLVGMMRRQCTAFGLPPWKDNSGGCDIPTRFLNKEELSVACATLLTLWIVICSKGTKSLGYTREVFVEILKKNCLIPRKKPKPLVKKPKSSETPSEVVAGGLQVFYDGSGRPDPLIGGAGFVILNDGKEIDAGSLTIPLGTNNVGEFQGCLIGLSAVQKFGKRAEIVGDCKILTDAARLSSPIDNIELNNILVEIRRMAKELDAIKFTHVPRELNKRADAIATAASWSRIDGMKATTDPKWDPRVVHLKVEDKTWLTLNSNLWKWIHNPMKKDWAFPIPAFSLTRTFNGRIVSTPIVYFPRPEAKNGSTIVQVKLTHPIDRWYSEKIQDDGLVDAMFTADLERRKLKRKKRTRTTMPMEFLEIDSDEEDKWHQQHWEE